MLDLDEIEARTLVAVTEIVVDDDCMVPIGGGNPYYHCQYCCVTNVELNMGEHSKKHAEWCESQKITRGTNDVIALINELRAARKCIEEVRDGFGCVGHYQFCKSALADYDKAVK